jgi:hypothetical protein
MSPAKRTKPFGVTQLTGVLSFRLFADEAYVLLRHIAAGSTLVSLPRSGVTLALQR